MLSNILIISVFREKIKVKLAITIPTGTLTTLPDEMIQTPLLRQIVSRISTTKSRFHSIMLLYFKVC